MRARALEAKGRSVIHLEIGEPDFDTPAHVVEARHRARSRREPRTTGRPRACPSCAQAVAEARRRARRGSKATPEMVVVTPGGKPIMFYLILALVDPGDEVLYPNPGFPIYESMIRYIGGVPVPVRLLRGEGPPARRRAADRQDHAEDAADRAQLAAQPDRRDHPRGRPRARSPDAAVRAEDPGALRRDLLADPLRRQARLDRRDAGMESLAIVLDGFSKTYAMTGWRLGYGIMPRRSRQVVAKLQTNAVSCTASFTQLAGVAGAHGRPTPRSTRWSRSSGSAATRSSTACARSRHQVRAAAGRLLRLPDITATGYSAKALADRLPPDEAGVACLSGTGLRRVGRGPPALQLRHQPREHPGSAPPHQDHASRSEPRLRASRSAAPKRSAAVPEARRAVLRDPVAVAAVAVRAVERPAPARGGVVGLREQHCRVPPLVQVAERKRHVAELHRNRRPRPRASRPASQATRMWRLRAPASPGSSAAPPRTG